MPELQCSFYHFWVSEGKSTGDRERGVGVQIRVNESKTVIKHISRYCKCKFDGKNVIQRKNRIMITAEVNVKNR